VITMVTKAKQKAAKQLGVPGKILIPVPDIIKVEDLEREIEEKNKVISEKDKAMDDLARENAELKRRLGLQ
jgi:predicted metal-dependent hydrolase